MGSKLVSKIVSGVQSVCGLGVLIVVMYVPPEPAPAYNVLVVLGLIFIVFALAELADIHFGVKNEFRE